MPDHFPVVLPLTQDDLDRMPSSLRDTLKQWWREHKPTSLLHDPSVMPAKTGLHDIALQLLRIEAGLAPVETLKRYVEAFDPTPASRICLAPVQAPLDVLTLAVSLRRGDLLDMVMQNPVFRLGSPEHTAWVGPTNREKDGGGGIALGVGHGTGYGVFVHFVMHHLLRTVGMPSRIELLEESDPLTAWCRTTVMVGKAVFTNHWEHWASVTRPFNRNRVKASSLGGFRGVENVNIVGLAVLMGDDASLNTLLSHGISPTDRVGAKHELRDPLLLAGIHGEKACALTLLKHPKMDVLHEFSRKGNDMVEPFPWGGSSETHERFPTYAGFSVEAVLRNPAFGRDRDVYLTLKARMETLHKITCKRLLTRLSTTSRQVWETGQLLDAMEDSPPAVASTPRSRL